MAQQPFEMSLLPTADPEETQLQETSSLTHESTPPADPPTDTADPEGSSLNRKENRNHRIWRLVMKPSVGVFIILLALTGVSFCPALLANHKPLDYITLYGVGPDTDGVKVLGNVFSFDWLDPSKVSVTWSVTGFGNYSLQTAGGFPGHMPPPNVPLDIYLDDPSEPIFSYDPTHLPVQPWDDEKLPVLNLLSFKMEHTIELGIQYYVPNDWYSFSAFVFAIERITNKSIPIITFEIGSSGPGDFRTTSEVVPSASEFTNGGARVKVESHTIFARVGRSLSARALTYSMFVINWVLAGCSIVTTSIAFNRGGGGGDVGITLLPITAILTIPIIRNLYVGSPPFGIYLDVVGFFPQMLIVAWCTVVVLSGYSFRSIWGKSASTKDEAEV